MRIHVRRVAWPDRMISPWLTRDRTVPTTAAMGPAVWAVRPRRMRPIASRRTLHTGVARIVAMVLAPPAGQGRTGGAGVWYSAGQWAGARPRSGRVVGMAGSMRVWALGVPGAMA